MKTLFIDCGMGAAGDMLTAALYELLDDKAAFFSALQNAGIPHVRIQTEKTEKNGICGTAFHVLVDGEEEEAHHAHHHHHHHSSMADIDEIVAGLQVSAQVQNNVMAVYRLIAEAESHAHGVPVSDIHFHEVGTMDAIADITAVCLLMEILKPEQILASPVHVGTGHVHCAHGILPVPAPATAYILRDVPIYGGNIEGELCTPTGAALLRHFVTSFGNMPVMRTKAIGYGMGKKEFSAVNCVRAFYGETDGETESIYTLCCNLDDMTPEAVAFAAERLLSHGALDVFTVPAYMKKGRQGVLLTVLCEEEKKAALVQHIFRYTTTLGVRESRQNRYVLSRTVSEAETPAGTVRKKQASGFGVYREKYEYADIARIAAEKEMSLSEAAAWVTSYDKEKKE